MQDLIRLHLAVNTSPWLVRPTQNRCKCIGWVFYGNAFYDFADRAVTTTCEAAFDGEMQIIDPDKGLKPRLQMPGI